MGMENSESKRNKGMIDRTIEQQEREGIMVFDGHVSFRDARFNSVTEQTSGAIVFRSPSFEEAKAFISDGGLTKDNVRLSKIGNNYFVVTL